MPPAIDPAIQQALEALPITPSKSTTEIAANSLWINRYCLCYVLDLLRDVGAGLDHQKADHKSVATVDHRRPAAATIQVERDQLNMHQSQICNTQQLIKSTKRHQRPRRLFLVSSRLQHYLLTHDRFILADAAEEMFLWLETADCDRAPQQGWTSPERAHWPVPKYMVWAIERCTAKLAREFGGTTQVDCFEDYVQTELARCSRGVTEEEMQEVLLMLMRC